MLAKKIAVVDIETTGPNFQDGDRIIQIAAVIYQDGRILNQYSMYINPSRSIPVTIQQLTGITDKEVAKAPSFEAVAQLWHHRLQDAVFVAHNLSFDYECLAYNFNKVGINFSPLAIDTVVLSKILFYDALGFNLTDLSQYCGLVFDNAHDALADAQVTGKILSKLIDKLQELTQANKDKIQQLLNYLPYDNGLVFQDSAWFKDHLGSLDIPQQRPANEDVLPSMNLNDQEIIDNLIVSYGQHLSIENDKLPLNRSFTFQMMKSLLSRSRKIILVSNHPEVYADYVFENKLLANHQAVLIAYPNDYIHKASFNKIIASVRPADLNQQEIIVACANIHWLQDTETGYYGEINQELNPQAFIEKFANHHHKIHNHYYFNRMIQESQIQPLVFIKPDYLGRMMDTSQTKLFDLDFSNYDLLIDHFKDFIKAYKRGYQKKVCLSKLFTLLKQAYDGYQPASSDYLNRLGLETLLHATGNLIDEMDRQVSKSLDKGCDDNQIIYYSFREDREKDRELLLGLKFWQEEIGKFMTGFQETSLDQNLWKDISYQLEQVLTMNFKSQQCHFDIQVNRIDGYLYHFKLYQRPAYFYPEQTAFVYQFKHSYICSLGAILNHPANLYQEIFPLPSHQPIVLKLDNKIKPLSGLIPIDYASFDIHDSHRLELILDFLKDRSDLSIEKTIIFMESMEACQKLYQILSKDESLSRQTSILSQTMSGSIQKIYRRFLEANQAVLILTYAEWLKISKHSGLLETHLLISKLPFKGPDHDEILSMKKLLDLEDDHLFESLIYPEMVQDFKEMLTYIPEFYILKEVFIFDHRILSKSYSRKLQDDLSDIIHFESYIS